MSVLIIVLNYNGASVLDECLKSLYAAKGPFDVLVIDNDSQDNSAMIADKYNCKVIRTGHNYGYAGGNNIGLRYAENNGYDYAILLNNDVVVSKGFLAPLLEAMDNLSVAFAGPKVYRYNSGVLSWAGGYVSMWRGRGVSIGDGELDYGQYETPQRTGFVNGCCIMIRVNALRKIGLLDERYYMYWEEADLCKRGEQAGYASAYAPASWIWHHTEGKGNPFLYSRNRYWYMKKYATFAQFSSFLLYNLLVDLPVLAGHYILHGDFKRLSSLLKGNLIGALKWPGI
jgi:GT2 family glycosyltransferase